MKKIIYSLLFFILVISSICGCGSIKAEKEIIGKWTYNTGLATWNFVFNEDGTCSHWSGTNEPDNSTYSMGDGILKVDDLEGWNFYYTIENNEFNFYHDMEEYNDWKFKKDYTYNPDTPKSLALTEDMIEEIEDKIESDEFETVILISQGAKFKDYTFTSVEFKNHKKTDPYTYKLYGVLYAEDNYGDKYRQNFDVTFIAVNDSSTKTGYSIDWTLQLVD